MQIQLKHFKIINFKGISSFETGLNHVTNIYGANASGKTTIFDAFLWLFFGKNSEGASQFDIKRLDINNSFIKNLNSEVSATLIINNQEIIAKKVLEQKWVKKKGSEDVEYNGDRNIYFWNDVPMTETEFKAKIAQIVDESIFKLITNPYYFNTLRWQDRRNTLISLAGNISNDEIFDSIVTKANKEQFDNLINALNANKTIDEYKREIAAKKLKIKTEAESIPSRIDEVQRGKPAHVNIDEINKEITLNNEKLKNIDDQLGNLVSKQAEQNRLDAEVLRLHNQKISDQQQKVFNIRTEIQNMEFDAKQKAKDQLGNTQSEINSVTRQIEDKVAEKKRYESGLEQLQTDLAKLYSDKEAVITEYDTEEAMEMDSFDDNSFSCPTCKQSLPAEDIESKKTELTKNFNRTKIAKIEEIRSRGVRINSEIEIVNQRITNGSITIVGIKTEIDQLNDKLNGLNLVASANTKSIEEITKDILDATPIYLSKRNELDQETDKKFTDPVFDQKEINDDDLKAQRKVISDKIADLRNELNKADMIAKDDARIVELTNQESELAQQLAQLEGTEYAILKYTKAKVDFIERKINGLFKDVKFKMFNQQVNGGEVECCETLVNTNGSFVPFSNANRAGQINAGMDIINTLSKHYDTYAPIFVDNREAVTELAASDSQVVNLFVSASDKTLRIA